MVPAADGWPLGVDRSIASGPGKSIRFTREPADAAGASVVVVLDAVWTPEPSDSAVSEGRPSAVFGLRELAGAVLAEHDLIAETSARLDAWAAASGVVDALTFRGTSFWFYVRLRHWLWLEERVLWAAIVNRITRSIDGLRTIEYASGVDDALCDVLRLVAVRDGLELIEEEPPVDRNALASRPEPRPGAGIAPKPVAKSASPSGFRRSPIGRALRRARNLLFGTPVPPAVLRQREIDRRLSRVRALVDDLAAEPEGRLLVVHEHARQRVLTESGPRWMNPYLDPIVDRLRGGALDPIVLDIRAQAGRDEQWERIGAGVEGRILPVDALVDPPASAPAEGAVGGATGPGASAAGRAGESLPAPPDSEVDPALAAWRDGVHCPVDAWGLDLGPLLAAEVASTASRFLPRMTPSVDRIQRFLERIRPAGILLADEYHRQDWMTAAAAVGVPVAAVQHGMIYRHHNGYIHPDRPAGLRLPQRTYVFGRWERDLLTTASVYRPDEVVVGGSPRLDLVRPALVDRAAIRRELGAADGERLVVVSGTWGGIYRRFHYPIALAALVDRPLPNVHIVVKLHPGEPDEGPYRRTIETAAAARGIEPPRVTIVQAIDLYALLAAADAHLGIQSTVLTEAVVTRTPNLLAAGLAGADLLGYVEAGVAVPVRNGGDLLAALDAAQDAAPDRRAEGEAAAVAFTTAHFEPGVASERIAADLTAWLG